VNNTESFTLGVVLGAGIMYYMDPDRGARRRALVRDQLVHAGHELDESTRSGARHVRNRAGGLVHEAKAQLTEGEVEDRVLVERVRSEMGRKLARPGEVEVYARDGEVVLTGSVASNEVQDLVRTVRSVRGVDRVENRLRVSDR
jgi:osmotically-inducible protein OsmY